MSRIGIFFRIDLLLITILINQDQVLGRKNRSSYRSPKINKGESPKCCSYCTKKDTFFQNVLKRNDYSTPQYSISCDAFKDPLMPIVIEKANLRFSKSQFDIKENNKPFITKGFVSLIGVITSLQSIKLLSYCVIRELPKL